LFEQNGALVADCFSSRKNEGKFLDVESEGNFLCLTSNAGGMQVVPPDGSNSSEIKKQNPKWELYFSRFFFKKSCSKI